MWIQTYTGKEVDPLNPNIDDINIVDIAHALSNLCRYTGHCSVFYSVAEHSVVGALELSEYIKYGLDRFTYLGDVEKNILNCQKQYFLHDASEAYLNDIARPVKPNLPGYKKIEEDLTKIIYQKFGLEYPYNWYVKDMDNIMLYSESQYLFSSTKDWTYEKDSWQLEKDKFRFYSPKDAKIWFLETYERLFNK
jgi:hypothetical protein